ncbi:MAG: hypothetical protein CVV22_11180 [Ignavibacteriae bacterium HGW-Ignavibacteriae-1]|jgi:hypothetical protein|nr:MAG: hypothetical protein CVV22_11180 [Ignavibacteriae bacterium HGW-Ignavibacteriae-1]
MKNTLNKQSLFAVALLFLVLFVNHVSGQSLTLQSQTLKLTHPNGGETFVVGSDTVITWEGVLPSDRVHLEYSTDNGQKWQTITNNASGLTYIWKNIPKPTSNRCLIRVNQIDPNNPAPQIEWQKTYGGSKDDRAYSIQETSDGGYIVVGESRSNDGDVTENKGDYDVWIFKLTIDGIIEWQKTYGGSNEDFAYSIKETKDSGYIVAGWTRSNDGDVTENKGYYDYDVWILKLTFDGSLEWQKTFGGRHLDFAQSIQETSDGGYIVAGNASSEDGDVTDSKGLGDVWVVKLSIDGNIEWQKTFGGSETDYANSIEKTRDGGYIVAGQSRSNDGDVSKNKGEHDVWILKLSTDGNIEWQMSFGGSSLEFAFSAHETKDGGYIVVGFAESNDGDITNNKGSWDAWVLKLRFDGSLEWQNTFGGSGSDSFRSVQEASNGGYVIVGSTGSNNGDVTKNKGMSDALVIKYEIDGSIEWQKTYGGTLSDGLRSIQETSDGSYIVAGFSNSNDGDVTENKGQSDVWVVKLAGTSILQSDVSDAAFSIVEPIASSKDIDMLQVLVGATKDSVINEFVSNVGTWKFRVDSLYIQGADASAFSLVAGLPVYTIEPNDSYFGEFRFVPNRVGLHTAEIVIITQSDTLKQSIIGEGIIDSSAITLKVLDAEGYATDGVKVYIIVTDSYLLKFSRTESFSLELNFNPSMLYPLDFPMDYIDDRNAKIKIEDLPVDVETGDTLATVWFRAGLGNAEISKLELTNIEAIGGNTTISHEDGTFKLLGICYEGGTRLFNANSKAGIESVNPNPAENLLEVDLLLNEEGQTELLIYNMQGEKVKELFKQTIGTLGAQSLKCDISDLSSGQYYLVLITPTYITTKNLIIMR